MHHIVQFFTCILVLGLLSACGKSIPTNYYTLLSRAETETTDKLPKSTLRIARVAIPQYLERESIAVRKEDHVQLAVDSIHLWAEPLSDGIRRVLQREMTPPLLRRGLTVLPLASEESGTYTLLVDILRLDGEFTRSVDFAAQWSLVESRTNTVLDDGIFTAQEELRTSSYQDLVLAESTLIRSLSAHILDRIASPPAKHSRVLK